MKRVTAVVLLAVAILLGLVFWMGCNEKQDLVTTPVTDQQGLTLTKENQTVKSIMTVQDRYNAALMNNPNVAGVATGLSDDGQLCILVFTKTAATTDPKAKTVTARTIPAQLEGVPVVIEVTGEFRAMKGRTSGHTAKQTPPIQLGTSGGWGYDLANGYCCSGTLGSLIQKGGNQYILSNYHVFWGDIVAGGNSRVATAGDPVIQPGMVDISCNAANAQNVANLSGEGSLPGANLDAGYAQIITGMVRTDGAILEIGTLSSQTVGTSIGQAVKKSGRTTGLTRSKVSGLNATISVQYETECAGTVAFTKTFTGQIIVTNKRSAFLNSGDSGSLMVEDVTTNPRAVGLLFAGSNTLAVANPIGVVLAWAGATMVGN